MTHIIRAVYRGGVLHPVTPLELQEGVEVHLEVLAIDKPPEHPLTFEDMMGDLLEPRQPIPPELLEAVQKIDRDALAKGIAERFRGLGLRPLSEDIIEERHNGP